MEHSVNKSVRLSASLGQCAKELAPLLWEGEPDVAKEPRRLLHCNSIGGKPEAPQKEGPVGSVRPCSSARGARDPFGADTLGRAELCFRGGLTKMRSVVVLSHTNGWAMLRHSVMMNLLFQKILKARIWIKSGLGDCISRFRVAIAVACSANCATSWRSGAWSLALHMPSAREGSRSCRTAIAA